MALGAVMVAGSAAPAGAASQIDFSGYYRLYNLNGTNMGHLAGDPAFTDSMFLNRLVFAITFRPTDELEIVTELRLPTARRWGSGNSGNNTGSGFRTHHYYANIKQDWGTISVGRFSQAMNQFGLGSLGYAPSYQPIFTYASPFDSGSPVEDGIRYKNKWDNGFGLMTQYTKRGNNSVGEGGGNDVREGASSDQDKDRLQVEGTYEWDGGGVALNLRYDRDASRDKVLFPGMDPDDFDSRSSFYINPAVMHSWGDFSFHFEGMAGWGETKVVGAGNRNLDEEGYAAYLDFDYNYGPGNITLSAWYNAGTGLDEAYNVDGKSKSLVSVNQGNFNPLLVALNTNWLPQGYRTGIAAGLNNDRTGDFSASGINLANNAYWNYVNGNDVSVVVNPVTAAQILNAPSIVGLSGGITWDGAGAPSDVTVDEVLVDFIAARNANNHVRQLSFNNATEANHWAIMLGGKHAFTDDITLHYAVGYLALNKPNYRIINTATSTNEDVNDGLAAWTLGYKEQDKDLGFEVDLGFSFQLLDNLQLTSSFGYMFNGDAYKQFKGYQLNSSGADDDTAATLTGVWEDADDSYVWQNTLTFSF
jgi:hypothetical protein